MKNGVLAIVIFILLFILSVFNSQGKAFHGMISNINNQEYFNSFIHQQPRITYKVIVSEYNYKGDDHPSVYNHYHFQFGSWESDPISIPNITNEIAIYRLTENYVLNDKAKAKHDEFYNKIENIGRSMWNFDKIEKNPTDTRLVCFGNKNSKLLRFYSSKFGKCLHAFTRLIGFNFFFEEILTRNADKYIQISVEKRISSDFNEYQYQFNRKDSGMFDPVPSYFFEDLYYFSNMFFVCLIPAIFYLYFNKNPKGGPLNVEETK